MPETQPELLGDRAGEIAVRELLLLTANLEEVPGVGVDVEEVRRWRPLPEIHVFSAEEVAHCSQYPDSAPAFAGRWCAKEAVIKALSSWVSLGPRDVEVRSGADGEPRVELRGARGAAWDGDIRLSIAHTSNVAICFALAVPAAAR